MQARTLTILSALNDLKNTCMSLLERTHKNHALLLIYSFIDICAALANDDKNNNRQIFKTYIETFGPISQKLFSSSDLWAARSSLLHAYSPLGHHTKNPDVAKPIFYYSCPDKHEYLSVFLKSKGYKYFIILNTEDIMSFAIDAFSSLYRQVTTDTEFENRFLRNSEDFLFDLHLFKLEEEWSIMEELGRQTQSEMSNE